MQDYGTSALRRGYKEASDKMLEQVSNGTLRQNDLLWLINLGVSYAVSLLEQQNNIQAVEFTSVNNRLQQIENQLIRAFAGGAPIEPGGIMYTFDREQENEGGHVYPYGSVMVHVNVYKENGLYRGCSVAHGDETVATVNSGLPTADHLAILALAKKLAPVVVNGPTVYEFFGTEEES